MKPMLMRLTLVLTILFGITPLAFSQVVIQTIPVQPETDWHKRGFWETMDGQSVEKSWEFSDGEVRLVKPRGGRGSILSAPLPSNFDLTWQWKVEKKTNTGLKYRVRRFGPKWLGVEYQITDDDNIHVVAMSVTNRRIALFNILLLLIRWK